MEDKNDEKIPNTIGIISIVKDVLDRFMNSTIPEIEIAGMPTRKESFAAVCLSIPENKAEVKVIPDLETPGNIAKDCETPKSKISLKLILENDLFFLEYISEKAINIDIRIETIAIENRPLAGESEKPGQYSFTSKPKINMGKLAIKI